MGAHTGPTLLHYLVFPARRAYRILCHKCSVCGVTDTDNPNMEFRYCSKCNGYYCYCMEHINNHTHVD